MQFCKMGSNVSMDGSLHMSSSNERLLMLGVLLLGEYTGNEGLREGNAIILESKTPLLCDEGAYTGDEGVEVAMAVISNPRGDECAYAADEGIHVAIRTIN